MNAVGWILILLLILIIIAGVILLIWYFVKIKGKKKTPDTPPSPPPPPPPSSQKLSILTSLGAPQYAMTNDTNKNVILRNPQGPTGATGSFADNICSRYSWSYAGGTGSIVPLGGTGGTGSTGGTGATGIVSGATGGYLIANWETDSSNYLTVKTTTTPKSGDPIITGTTGPTINSFWTFVPDPVNLAKGKWCLTGVTDRALCLYYGVTGANPIPDQQLTIKEYKINDSDPGFVFTDTQPLSSNTTPTCNAG